MFAHFLLQSYKYFNINIRLFLTYFDSINDHIIFAKKNHSSHHSISIMNIFFCFTKKIRITNPNFRSRSYHYIFKIFVLTVNMKTLLKASLHTFGFNNYHPPGIFNEFHFDTNFFNSASSVTCAPT